MEDPDGWFSPPPTTPYVEFEVRARVPITDQRALLKQAISDGFEPLAPDDPYFDPDDPDDVLGAAMWLWPGVCDVDGLGNMQTQSAACIVNHPPR